MPFKFIAYRCLLPAQAHTDYDTESFNMHDSRDISAAVQAEIELQLREASLLDFELAYDHRRRHKTTQNWRQVVLPEILAMDCGAG